MGRVLRIGAMLMGVLLVVMTAGLWIRRATTEPEYAMLFYQSSDDASTALVLRVPELNYVRQITPKFDEMRILGGMEDGHSILLVTRGSGSTDSTLYRLDSEKAGLNVVADIPIVGYFGDIHLSADRRWLMYGERDISGNQVCHLFNIQTGESRNLADFFPGFLAVLCDEFSADSQWAWVMALEVLEGVRPEHAYRIRLNDGLVENIGRRFGDADIYKWSLEEKWVIAAIEQEGSGTRRRVYRTDPNNIDWQPILNTSPTVLSTHGYNESLVEWLPEQKLIMVYITYDQTHQQIVAIPLEGGSPRWIVGNLDYLWNLNNPDDWLFFIGHRDSLYRMHPDGTDFSLIADFTVDDYPLWEYIIKDQVGVDWLYVASAPRDVGPYMIWRMHLDGSHSEKVIQHPEIIRIRASSPDHQWLLLETDADEDSWYIYHRARLDGSDKQFVLADPNSYFFDWSLSPTKPSQPVLLLMLGSGLIAISIFGKRPYQIVHQRLRPAA